ncbi:MAG: neutral zinc metallopeptidase [Amylibacter sp.]
MFDVDVSSLLNATEGSSVSSTSATLTKEDKSQGEFVSATLGYTEQIWDEVFRTQVDSKYSHAILVLYKGVSPSHSTNYG